MELSSHNEAAAPLLQVLDYTVLPITLPPLPSFPRKVTHYLYLRPHFPKQPHPDSSRSLFAVNVPIDSTLSHFRALFSQLHHGSTLALERVDFSSSTSASTSTSTASQPQSTPLPNKKRKRAPAPPPSALSPSLPTTWDRPLHPSGSTAVLTFADAQTATSALRAASRSASHHTPPVWPTSSQTSTPPLGSARYCAHAALSHPDTDAVQAAVDAYMTALAASEARAAQTTSEPDADGFVTVTRGPRGGAARKAAAEKKAEEMRAREEKRRERQGDFYRFQGRERRKEEARRRRERFEEDRRRMQGVMKRRKGV